MRCIGENPSRDSMELMRGSFWSAPFIIGGQTRLSSHATKTARHATRILPKARLARSLQAQTFPDVAREVRIQREKFASGSALR
jgi:hypothetical protein